MAGARSADAPSLTVTVIPFSGPEQLGRCLRSLEQQDASPPLEILVPCDDASGGVEALAPAFPAVEFVRVPGRSTPAELRSLAVRRASGRIVALIEDHGVPGRDWCVRVLDAHRQPFAAVGGAIEKGSPPERDGDSMLAWALYLADYSRYMNPLAAGPVRSLSDCNATYKRDVLLAMEPVWANAFHENVVNDELLRRGHELRLDPGLIVYEHRPMTWGQAVRDRFTFGRLFGSTRVEGVSLPRRLVRAAVCPLLPAVLLLRVARNLWSRRRHRLQFVRCGPALLLVAAVWVAGECVGYLTGSAGPLEPSRPGPAAADRADAPASR